MSVSGLNLITLHATLKKNCINKLVNRSYQAFELQASCSEHVDGLLILVRKSATKKFFENKKSKLDLNRHVISWQYKITFPKALQHHENEIQGSYSLHQSMSVDSSCFIVMSRLSVTKVSMDISKTMGRLIAAAPKQAINIQSLIVDRPKQKTIYNSWSFSNVGQY